MAANDDFPRGQIVSERNAGIISLTIPAIAGVSHVLTDVIAMLNGATGAVPMGMTILDGLGYAYGDLVIPTGSPNYTADSLAWSGKRQWPMNASMTVEFNAYIAGSVQFLELHWYDV